MLSKGCGEAPKRPPTFSKVRNPRRGIHYFGDDKKAHPRYSFPPSIPTASPKKKTHKSKKSKTLRCQRIAELISEGKKGSVLVAAVKDYDETNPVIVVAHFDEPVPASLYKGGTIQAGGYPCVLTLYA